MPADRDYTTAAACAELRRLLATATKGELSAAVRRQQINDLANALPALLDAIDRDEALLRQCYQHLAGYERRGDFAARILLSSLRAAGFTTGDSDG